MTHDTATSSEFGQSAPDGATPPKLYFMPGTCALGVHIALEWAGEPYEVEEVAYQDLNSPNYLAINPAGVVPALKMGDRVLTEASAIMLALARRYPILDIGRDSVDEQRFEFERVNIFLGGTLHPHFWPWFVPQRYGAASPQDGARVKAAAELLIAKDFHVLDERLEGRDFLMGERPTAADAYFFPMARWGYGLQIPTSKYLNIDRFMRRMSQDNGVRAAMAAQKLEPLYRS